jgi:hypothetical protein
MRNLYETANDKALNGLVGSRDPELFLPQSFYSHSFCQRKDMFPYLWLTEPEIGILRWVFQTDRFAGLRRTAGLNINLREGYFFRVQPVGIGRSTTADTLCPSFRHRDNIARLSLPFRSLQ